MRSIINLNAEFGERAKREGPGVAFSLFDPIHPLAHLADAYAGQGREPRCGPAARTGEPGASRRFD